VTVRRGHLFAGLEAGGDLHAIADDLAGGDEAALRRGRRPRRRRATSRNRAHGRGRHQDAGRAVACSICAVANVPALSEPSALATTASTISVRESVCSAGDT
jgi:hypothetical protein